MGEQPVELLTKEQNGKIIKEYVYEETIESINETSLSTTIKCSSSMLTTLELQAKIPGAEFSANKSISKGYEIGQTVTYTTAQRESVKVKFEVKQEFIEGRHFYMGMVGKVYKITWQTWQVDDYWWGDYEVSGSRKTYEGYIVIRPYLTIVYDDGSFVA